jgi:hypothetical protein
MGITSYSQTHTFIHIQNDEIHVHILMPLLMIEMWQPVAESLLRNVYRAFDYHSESDVYDALNCAE